MKIWIDIKKLLVFTFGFLLCTVIGTLSHEYGHLIVAKSLGYKTTLHFASVNYDGALNSSMTDGLLVTIGGPLQTTLTGTLGLLFLIWRRKLIYSNGPTIIDWLAIYLSLFWLREVYNPVLSIGNKLITKDGLWFGGDERIISESLNLWYGTVPIIFGIIGTIISIYVIFNIIPKTLRLTFILSGLIGGIFGFILWMKVIGPNVLP